MKYKLIFSLLAAVLACVVMEKTCDAFVFISEIYADPKAALEGDANYDGIVSSADDEFVEIFNDSDTAVDLSAWYISDNIRTRHVFMSGSVIAPRSFYVVFGGGAPVLSGIDWNISSTGSLSLNNSGDKVSVFNNDGDVIDVYAYGTEGGRDQSLYRDAYSDPFMLHAESASTDGRLFSPGYLSDGTLYKAEQPANTATVPEPSGILLMLQSGLLMGLGRFFKAA